MSRIRTIKPGFFRSKSLSQCSLEARITFAGLWTEADDQGRGDATPRLLATALWPWDNPTDEEVDEWLHELADTGHIALYPYRDSQLFQVLRWTEHQAAAYRRGVSDLPPPPEMGTTPDRLHTSARPVVQESAIGVQESASLEGNGQDEAEHASSANDVVRQSVDIYAEWVYATEPEKCRTTAARYKRGIARNAAKDHADEIATHLKWHPTATAADIAAKVLGVPGIGSTREQRPPQQTWHFDPACDEHGADGMVTMPDGGAGSPVPCPCRRAEPYPEPSNATIHELRLA